MFVVQRIVPKTSIWLTIASLPKQRNRLRIRPSMKVEPGRQLDVTTSLYLHGTKTLTLLPVEWLSNPWPCLPYDITHTKLLRETSATAQNTASGRQNPKTLPPEVIRWVAMLHWQHRPFRTIARKNVVSLQYTFHFSKCLVRPAASTVCLYTKREEIMSCHHHVRRLEKSMYQHRKQDRRRTLSQRALGKPRLTKLLR